MEMFDGCCPSLLPVSHAWIRVPVLAFDVVVERFVRSSGHFISGQEIGNDPAENAKKKCGSANAGGRSL